MVSAAEIPPEILVSIFKYNQCHKDLLNFALVCRSWTEWATDVRWRTCEVPLQKIFTILDLSNERDPEVDNDTDWTQFVAISNKLTRVKCDFCLQPSEAANFDERRKQHEGAGDAPFRNVLELIVSTSSSDLRTASIVCSVESPKSIRMYQSVNGFHGSMDPSWLDSSNPFLSFAPYAPSVEFISVDYPNTLNAPSLHRFARLRVVECHLPIVTGTWWKDLATCPKLTDLRLRLATANRTSDWVQHVVFPVLEKFHYTAPANWMVPKLLYQSAFPVLRHFVLRPCPEPWPAEIITGLLRSHSPLLQQFRSEEDFVAQQ